MPLDVFWLWSSRSIVMWQREKWDPLKVATGCAELQRGVWPGVCLRNLRDPSSIEPRYFKPGVRSDAPPFNLPWENVHFRPQQHQARSFLEEYGPEGGLHGAQRSYDPIPWKETSGVKTLWFLESIMQAGNSVQVEAGVACDRFMYVEHALGIPPSYTYCIQCLERFWKYRVGFCSSRKSAQHQSVIMFMVTAHSIILVVMVVINTTISFGVFFLAVKLLMWNFFFSNAHQSA